VDAEIGLAAMLGVPIEAIETTTGWLTTARRLKAGRQIHQPAFRVGSESLVLAMGVVSARYRD